VRVARTEGMHTSSSLTTASSSDIPSLPQEPLSVERWLQFPFQQQCGTPALVRFVQPLSMVANCGPSVRIGSGEAGNFSCCREYNRTYVRVHGVPCVSDRMSYAATPIPPAPGKRAEEIASLFARSVYATLNVPFPRCSTSAFQDATLASV
jgi:hypothetical protein